MSEQTKQPFRLRVPHDEPDERKVASWPNPDHQSVDEALERARAIVAASGNEADKLALLRVMELADAYLYLTTARNQSECARTLRSIWRARRAEGGQ